MRLTVEPSPDLRASLSRPLQLLIAAARSTACAVEQVEMTRSDWDDLAGAAERHGLSGVLHTAVNHSTAPAAVREQAAIAAHERATAGLRGIAEAIDITRVDADIDGCNCVRAQTADPGHHL